MGMVRILINSQIGDAGVYGVGDTGADANNSLNTAWLTLNLHCENGRCTKLLQQRHHSHWICCAEYGASGAILGEPWLRKLAGSNCI